MTIKHKSAQKGFSLVELLVVIVVIGILASIIIPVVGKVRESAAKTAGRAQFSQWRQALELYRQEYGYYPRFAPPPPGNPTNDDFYINQSKSESNYDGNRFYESLTGRVAAGSDRGERLDKNDDGYKAGNIRSATFYTFPDNEIEEKDADTLIIRDHFDNRDIVVYFDLNQDGVVSFGSGPEHDYTSVSLPEVTSVRTEKTFKPEVGDGPGDQIPTTGVRAAVIFYSAGYGDELFMSWK